MKFIGIKYRRKYIINWKHWAFRLSKESNLFVGNIKEK